MHRFRAMHHVWRGSLWGFRYEYRMRNLLALLVRGFRTFDHNLNQGLVLVIPCDFYEAHQKRLFALQSVMCVKDCVRSSTTASRQNLEGRKHKRFDQRGVIDDFPNRHQVIVL